MKTPAIALAGKEPANSTQRLQSAQPVRLRRAGLRRGAGANQMPTRART